MKKILKFLFKKNRIDLIRQNLTVKRPVILEIGIHKGNFSNHLIANFDTSKLVLVDPWIAYDDLIYQNSWYGNSHKSNQNIQDEYYNNLIGKKTTNARIEIIAEIERQKLLVKRTPLKHAVKCAERSGSPIEILLTKQWFIKILDHKEDFAHF